MIDAKVILYSVSPQGHKLPTFKLRYPKFIHGEAKTHRVLRIGNEGGYYVLDQEVGFMDDPNISRNASSSRAIPVPKMIAEVRSEFRAGPVYWGKEQKGMAAGEEFVGDDLIRAQEMWKFAALDAANRAEEMYNFGIHKSIVNRIIEPYLHINVVATATEWDNFYGLRLDKAAQPEARALAIAMWNALKESTPKLLKPGEWHLPFVGDNDYEFADAIDRGMQTEGDYQFYQQTGLTWPLQLKIRTSVARCARVSYESFETGKRSTVDEDLKLYERLLGSQPLHASPAEHQATPDFCNQIDRSLVSPAWEHRDQWGNLVGWRQYRKMLKGEAVAPIPEEFR